MEKVKKYKQINELMDDLRCQLESILAVLKEIHTCKLYEIQEKILKDINRKPKDKVELH